MRTRPGSMRPVHQSRQALGQIPTQPGMHANPRHPECGRDLDHRGARQHGTDRVQSLLNLGQDNQSHSRPPTVAAPTNTALRMADYGQLLSIN
jgi:hypothetical protein